MQDFQLTPEQVNSGSFGKYFAYPVQGYVYAQPHYLSGLTINGSTYNVVFVVTEHDIVYAFDADVSHQLWSVSLVDPAHGAASGATTVPSSDVGIDDIKPEIGITSTPVIDAQSGTLYVVAKSKENAAYVQRLRAIDVTTGQERANSPVVISGRVPGTGAGSSNGIINFNPLIQLNREGLLLLNGQVYIGFGSHGNQRPYHGWILTRTASSQYVAPISVSVTTTIHAVAAARSYTNSSVITGRYTIAATSPPTFSPAPGTYSSAQTVSIAHTTPGAAIYYTTNGTAPTNASLLYQGPIPISVSTTIKASATAPGFNSSSITTGIHNVTGP